MMTIFEALADPTRRRILDLLRERPRLVGELADLLAISQPGVSKQLRLLRESGLVNVRQDAQRRWYELRPAPLAQIDAWLENYRHLLEEKYQRLDSLLETLKEEQKTNG
ncbi:MAG: winged helix-turn-helix transcriptional regulator [Chloroflexi bacterium]|nr:winged helix-turn-helix transcriptional regulator [Chloroflexota bacterium]